MEILKCEDLSKVYGSGASQVIALDKINLSVHKGEFVAIVGGFWFRKIHIAACDWKRGQTH